MNAKQKGVALMASTCRGTLSDGFTITELLVVIATTGILIAVVLPTLAFSKARPQAVQCLSNFNQLAKACAMYTSDNHEYYPPNPDDAAAPAGYTWCMGDMTGWVSLSAGGSANAGNAMYVTNSQDSLLAPYLGNRAAPFKCPTDWRVCRFNGQVVPVVRSVSVNAGVGTVDSVFATSGGGHAGVPTLPVNGPWLNGFHSHKADQPYATFGKTTDFRNCSPAEIWTYVDDDPWTINDASMQVDAATIELIDYPNTRHNNATGFAFADGHTEMHGWKSRIFIHNGPVSAGETVNRSDGLAMADWQWWVWHATRSFKSGTVP